MTRKLLIISLLVVVAFGACSKGGAHLSHTEMEAIMLDATLAEAASAMGHQTNQHGIGIKNTDTLARYYNDICAHHHITMDQLNNSFAWYKLHQDELDTIITHVSAKADKMLVNYEKTIRK